EPALSRNVLDARRAEPEEPPHGLADHACEAVEGRRHRGSIHGPPCCGETVTESAISAAGDLWTRCYGGPREDPDPGREAVRGARHRRRAAGTVRQVREPLRV